ncbi:MAG: polysaccharide deacetylase family protein [Fimbriimonadaceae bacterium]
MTAALLLTQALLRGNGTYQIPAQFKGKTTTHRIPHTERQLALTFDDGPDPIYTPIILDALKRHNAKATFFVLGKNAINNPLLLQRIVLEGHAIGTHSYTHRASMSIAEAENENTLTQAIVLNATGIRTNLFRAPYGLSHSYLNKNAIHRGWASFNWSATAADTATKDPEVVYKNVCFTPNPGEIILMHDVKPHTAKAIEKILNHLDEVKFKCVTIPELIRSAS